MITIPLMTTVADLQRGYRKLINSIKKAGEPVVIINNGKPEAVLVDVDTYEAQVEKLNELEEEYLLKVAQEGLKEYKKGKTIEMHEDETLLDVLKRTDEN